MRQHLADDAMVWAPPAPQFRVLAASYFYLRLVPGGPPLPSRPWNDTLYNRPPPGC